MYNIDILKAAANAKIGWRQNDNTFDFKLAPDLVLGAENVAYQDVHPLLTLANVKSVAPSFLDRYPAWDVAQEYLETMRVVYDSKIYYSKRTNTGKAPIDNPLDWSEIDSFSEWLAIKTNAAIGNVFRSIWVDNLSKETAHNILLNSYFINTKGREKIPLQNTSKRVGFALALSKKKGVAIKLDSIGMHFSEGTTLKLHLHNSSSNTEVLIGTYTCEANVEKWVDVAEDIRLAFSDGLNDIGGEWFITYDQSELDHGAEALNIELDSADISCSKFVAIKAVEAEPTEPKITGLRDYVESANTFGLNCKYTVLCDTTEAVAVNMDSFIKLIGLQVAKDMLLEFAYNPQFNINRTQQNLTKMELLYELDGDSQSNKKSGLKYELEKAYKAVNIDLSYLNPECFKRRLKRVRMKSI